MFRFSSKINVSLGLAFFIFLATTPVNAYYSNDPQGEMFIQKPFGDLSNCGPLSALMLTKFAHGNKNVKNISDLIDDARMTVQKQEQKDISYRWWTFKDIRKFLKQQQINYSVVDTKDFRYAQSRSLKIVKSLVAGNVIVINIDMNDLKKDSEIGKFYSTTKLFGRWGHFLVLVGYKKVNGQLAYEIHDSYSNKGKNRLFYAKDINEAISKYNKNLLLVKKPNITQENTLSSLL